MNKEAKIKIAARMFYEDNQDDYENYAQAVKEASEVMSEAFVDTVVRGTTRATKGYRVLFREADGHVARVRTEDDYFEPITLMTLEEGEALESEFDKLAEDNDTNVSAIVLLQQCGWVLV